MRAFVPAASAVGLAWRQDPCGCNREESAAKANDFPEAANGFNGEKSLCHCKSPWFVDFGNARLA